MVEIIFCADIHGSTITWKKFLELVQMKTDCLFILSGDLTGKKFASIYRTPEEIIIKDSADILSFYDENKFKYFLIEYEKEGGYFKEFTNIDTHNQYTKSRAKYLIDEKIQRLKKWMVDLSSINLNNNLILITPGNDDPEEIDIISELNTPDIRYGMEIFDFKGYYVYSFSYVNPTPWNTPRELDEESLESKLEIKLSVLVNHPNLIFNFHCPPFNTCLDVGPKLTDKRTLTLGVGGVETEHVGSKAIRRIIEKYRPILSLHGHIHESHGVSKIGNTLCFNPGSDYEKGILKYVDIKITNQHTEFKLTDY